VTGPEWLYGRPTAAELVAAVADFLDHDVRSATRPDGRPADAGQVSFHARVAANVLRTVERELTDSAAATAVAAPAIPTRQGWPPRSVPVISTTGPTR
jgi:hypothetical protein